MAGEALPLCCGWVYNRVAVKIIISHNSKLSVRNLFNSKFKHIINR